jgi:hypothetical protein
MSEAGQVLRVSRRTTLRWFAGAMATGQLAACGVKADGVSWMEVAAVQAPGYGTDPDLMEPTVPWPLTLSRAQREAVAVLADLILPPEGDYPAPSAVGVPDFIDEWVSAPYPDQHKDRALVIPGLAWLDSAAQAGGGAATFAASTAGVQAAVLDRIAWKDRVEPGLEKPAEFLVRVRSLTLGAYYSTREGWKELRYPGNTPSSGPYPGPTQDALDHLRGVVEGMGLTFSAG